MEAYKFNYPTNSSVWINTNEFVEVQIHTPLWTYFQTSNKILPKKVEVDPGKKKNGTDL